MATTTANLPALPSSLTPEGNLSRYLSEIRKFPLLEPQEEHACFGGVENLRAASPARRRPRVPAPTYPQVDALRLRIATRYQDVSFSAEQR